MGKGGSLAKEERQGWGWRNIGVIENERDKRKSTEEEGWSSAACKGEWLFVDGRKTVCPGQADPERQAQLSLCQTAHHLKTF